MESMNPPFFSVSRIVNMMKRTVVSAALVLLVSTTGWFAFTVAGLGTIGLLPPSTTLNLFAGQTGTYQLKVHDGLASKMIVHLSIVVSKLPLGGRANDVGLSYPNALLITPGNTFVNVTVTVSQSAAPGTYMISNTVYQ
jgi:hypothetical protein